MAETTRIGWTKSTFNPWIGCTKIGPGCDHCYAADFDARTVFDGVTHWGDDKPRKRTSVQNWNIVRRWNRIAPETEFNETKGFWPVFCASLADIFDNKVPKEWRADLWALIRDCPNLTFLLLTKRIGNVQGMLPDDWGAGYPNVWLGATVVNQEEADRDIPKLLQIPAKVRFLSVEPMLGRLDLCEHFGMWWNSTMQCFESTGIKFNRPAGQRGLDWTICGGESGTKARPMHPDWARSLRDQCAAAGVPFFFKQWGEWCDINDTPITAQRNSWGMFRIGTKAAGNELDGIIYEEFPEV